MISHVDPKILSKIKKCLALSASSNPNEAATALRQAKALMDKHGVASHHVTMSDIGEFSSKSNTMARDKPAQWESNLAVIVGKAFGCKVIVSTLENKYIYNNIGNFVFVGVAHNAEISAYTFSVLARNCKKARQEWIKENLSGLGAGYGGIKAKKTKMGDNFAEGWVYGIHQKVVEFANAPKIQDAIDKHIKEQSSGNAKSRDAGDVGKAGMYAMQMGMRAAKDEQIHRPMGKNSDRLAIENSS